MRLSWIFGRSSGLAATGMSGSLIASCARLHTIQIAPALRSAAVAFVHSAPLSLSIPGARTDLVRDGEDDGRASWHRGVSDGGEASRA